jgi:hypothetical protein
VKAQSGIGSGSDAKLRRVTARSIGAASMSTVPSASQPSVGVPSAISIAKSAGATVPVSRMELPGPVSNETPRVASSAPATPMSTVARMESTSRGAIVVPTRSGRLTPGVSDETAAMVRVSADELRSVIGSVTVVPAGIPPSSLADGSSWLHTVPARRTRVATRPSESTSRSALAEGGSPALKSAVTVAASPSARVTDPPSTAPVKG